MFWERLGCGQCYSCCDSLLSLFIGCVFAPSLRTGMHERALLCKGIGVCIIHPSLVPHFDAEQMLHCPAVGAAGAHRCATPQVRAHLQTLTFAMCPMLERLLESTCI